TSIGNVFIEDLKIVPDVNHSGYPDILVSGISPNIHMIEGLTGINIWSNSTGGNILGKDVLGDLNSDGIPEVGSASLNDLIHVYNSVTGNIIFDYAFGGGTNSFAAEHIVDLDDVDGNFSNEFAACSRDGRVILFSGGDDIVPVELFSFTANTFENNVQLFWMTATETNNSGFSIERKMENQDWITIGYINGHGTTTVRQSYNFIDDYVSKGTYAYRLKQINYDGTYEYSNQIEVEVGSPLNFTLQQNYPNPFNPATKIKYSIPNKSKVSLKIYDMLGGEVAELVSGEIEAGYYEMNFDGSSLSSGVYFYRLQAGDPSKGSGQSFVETKKMILLK
ncbi:MAG TPA: T9SS type A sorting domain-containing protein, partial [Ignavibacteriaceae bacterium]